MRETEIITTLQALIEMVHQEIRFVKERRTQDLIRLFEKKERLLKNLTSAMEVLRVDDNFKKGFLEKVYNLNKQLNEYVQEAQSYYDVALEVNRRFVSDLSGKILGGSRLKEQYNHQAKVKYDAIHRPVSLSLNEEL